MRLFKIVCVSILLSSRVLCAADFYIGQTESGTSNGADCDNAHALSGLTWGDGNDVSAGDTLHLCGTFTDPLTIGDSGEVGSPYTILFETDAIFSKGGGWSAGAIIMANKSYIVVDGGTNGTIESTDNGSSGSYTNQENSIGIYLTGCSNLEIKNLTLRNLYVRDASDDFAAATDESYGVASLSGGENISVHDCTMSYVYRFVSLYYVGSVSNYSLYNCTFTNGAGGIWVAGQQNSSVLTGISVYSNTMDLGSAWSFNDNNNRWHAEFVHLHSDGYTDMYIHNSKIYNNTFGPKVPMKLSASATTAWVFDEAKGNNHWIYNNLFLSDSGYSATDGLIRIGVSSSGTGHLILNNSFVQSGSRSGTAISVNGSDPDLQIKNNIIINTVHGIYTPQDLDLTSPLQIDTNFYYSVEYWGQFYSWATWLEGEYDDGSTNDVDPSLDANYVPDSVDSPVVDVGSNLSSYFTTDKAGTERSGAWDIGAYEYDEGGGAPTTTTITGLEIR